MSALYEFLFQLFDITRILNCIYLRTRHHTVTHLCLREIQGILEDTHLLLDILLVLGIIDTALHQIVQVHLSKLLVFRRRVPFDAKHAQQLLREHRGKTGNGIEHHIAQPRRKREKGQHHVGIALEDSLRQELSRKKHYQRREERICRHTGSTLRQWCKKGLVKDISKEDTIDHQGNIISHEHRGHKSIGMLIEQRDGLLCQPVFLASHLHQHPIARYERYLHP